MIATVRAALFSLLLHLIVLGLLYLALKPLDPPLLKKTPPPMQIDLRTFKNTVPTPSQQTPPFASNQAPKPPAKASPPQTHTPLRKPSVSKPPKRQSHPLAQETHTAKPKPKPKPKPKSKPKPKVKPTTKPKSKSKPQAKPTRKPLKKQKPTKPKPKKSKSKKRPPKRYQDPLANALMNLSAPAKASRPASRIDRMIRRLYGKEFLRFSADQKRFIRTRLNEIQRITQNTLVRLGYPETALRTRQQGTNVVEFYLHPNGNISRLRLKRKMGYSILDRNTLEVIRTAYKDYPRPKRKTKIIFYVTYSIR